jgi:mannose/fructose/N-acetylgalactosamine-specific phosphotransferase system component IID
MKWDWLCWQVLAPLFTPIAISLAVVLFDQIGPHPYPIKWNIVTDTPPWALIFFCLTLIGAALHDISAGKQNNGLFWMLIVLGIFVAIFAAEMVKWRQTEKDFEPGLPLYYAAFVFFLVSIGLCQQAAMPTVGE